MCAHVPPTPTPYLFHEGLIRVVPPPDTDGAPHQHNLDLLAWGGVGEGSSGK